MKFLYGFGKSQIIKAELSQAVSDSASSEATDEITDEALLEAIVGTGQQGSNCLPPDTGRGSSPASRARLLHHHKHQ